MPPRRPQESIHFRSQSRDRSIDEMIERGRIEKLQREEAECQKNAEELKQV